MSRFSGSFNFALRFFEHITRDLGAGTIPQGIEVRQSYDYGDGTGQINEGTMDVQSGIAAGQTRSLDLTTPLTDLDGDNLAFDEIEFIAIQNSNPTYRLEVNAGPLLDDSSDRAVCPAGGFIFWQGGDLGAAFSLDVETIAGSSANGWKTLVAGRDTP